MRVVAYMVFFAFVLAACSTPKTIQQEPEKTNSEINEFTTDNTIQEEVTIEKASSTISEPIIHIVKKGENLWVIAKNYGVTVKDIVNANNIENASLVKIGQQLTIPKTIR